MIRGGQIKYALVIGAELLTRYVDYTIDQPAFVGDGAGAAAGSVEAGREYCRQDQIGWAVREQLYAPGGGRRGFTGNSTRRSLLQDEGQRGF